MESTATRKPLSINRCMFSGYMTNSSSGPEQHKDMMDIKCCKLNNSIMRLLQSNINVITQCRKLNIRPLSNSIYFEEVETHARLSGTDIQPWTSLKCPAGRCGKQPMIN